VEAEAEEQEEQEILPAFCSTFNKKKRLCLFSLRCCFHYFTAPFLCSAAFPSQKLQHAETQEEFPASKMKQTFHPTSSFDYLQSQHKVGKFRVRFPCFFHHELFVLFLPGKVSFPAQFRNSLVKQILKLERKSFKHCSMRLKEDMRKQHTKDQFTTSFF
jgi:hypothetical protein